LADLVRLKIVEIYFLQSDNTAFEASACRKGKNKCQRETNQKIKAITAARKFDIPSLPNLSSRA
jgi:hypothetical protein